jgi:chaperone modulatory protein CbpM
MSEREIHTVEVIEQHATVTVVELCRSCGIGEEQVGELLDEGILEAEDPAASEPRFTVASLRRTHVTLRLQRDLGVNLAGAALALELMDRIEELKGRLAQLQ